MAHVKTPLPDRFWTKVDKSGGHHACWLWTRALKNNGYGSYAVSYISPKRYKQEGVHRIAYKLTYGPIPLGMVIDHLCRNRSCCNPLHLEAVTPRENLMRGEGFVSNQARRTHCPKGHPLSGDNLYEHKGKYGKKRHCKLCRKTRDATPERREYLKKWKQNNRKKK